MAASDKKTEFPYACTTFTTINYSNVTPQNNASFVMEDNILKGVLEPIDDNEQKIGQILLDTLNEHPDHVSQIDAESGKQTTYGEMKDRGIRCALWLKGLGIGPNDIVVACTHYHLDSYIPLLATFFVDAIFNAWNSDITIHTARRYIKQFTPKVIFSCENAANVLVEASKLENLDVHIVVFGKHSSLPILDEIMGSQTKEEMNNFTIVNVKSSKELALILLSSGSTGFPKGVMKSGKVLMLNLKKQSSSTNLAPRILWYSRLAWGSIVTFTLYTIVAKQTRIIPTFCEVENLFQIIEKYQVNGVFLPPVFMTQVAKSQLAQRYNLRSLNVIFVGGSKSSKQVFECLKQMIPAAFVHHLYATTEIGVISCSTPACKHIDSVGFIATNVQAKLIDLVSGETLGPNQQGEICVKSPAVMIGYYNDTEASEEAFDKEGWYRTGDVGYYDEFGEIFIVDRIKEMIKYKNYPISPVEIEEVLLSHPGIQEAIVFGLPHEADGEWPVALCKKTTGSKVTEDEIMKLASVLEDYKKLRGGIQFIDNFLYTSSGKIARNEMKRMTKNLLKI